MSQRLSWLWLYHSPCPALNTSTSPTRSTSTRARIGAGLCPGNREWQAPVHACRSPSACKRGASARLQRASVGECLTWLRHDLAFRCTSSHERGSVAREPLNACVGHSGRRAQKMVVPGAGLEPASPLQAGDFESPALGPSTRNEWASAGGKLGERGWKDAGLVALSRTTLHERRRDDGNCVGAVSRSAPRCRTGRPRSALCAPVVEAYRACAAGQERHTRPSGREDGPTHESRAPPLDVAVQTPSPGCRVLDAFGPKIVT